MKQGRELLDAYINGEGLTPEQGEALSAWICASQENSRLAAHLMHQDQSVAEAVRGHTVAPLVSDDDSGWLVFGSADTDGEDNVQEELPPIHLPSQQPLTKQQYASALSYMLRHTFTPKRIAVLATAAAVLLGVVVVIVFLTGGEETPEVTTVPDVTPVTPAPDVKRVVAMVTDQVNAQWSNVNGQATLPNRLLLKANQRLTLVEGFAEITTNRGAKVLLQAPATIATTKSDNAIRLEQGKIVGRCETASSKGFTVFAPGVEVIDLSTAFGVEAHRDGTSTIMVMDGSVLVKPTVLSPEAFEPVVIHRDQARRVLAETGALETITVDNSPVFHTEPVHPYVATVREAKPLTWLRMNELSPDNLLGSARFRQVSEGYRAIQLDGKGCIDVGDVMDFEADQPMSFAGWVKLDQEQVDAFVLGRIALDEDRGFHGYDLYLKDQRLRFQLIHRFEAADKPDAQMRVESSVPLVAGQWHHIAATYDGSRRGAGVRLYIDGQPVLANVLDDTLGENSILARTTFRLGIRGLADPQPDADLDALDTVGITKIGSPLIGAIGDFVVFDRTLRSEEIEAIHLYSEPGYSED
ncbi:MAG: LamG domain-containing protein [Planctomycetota bacterium]